jgi:hypothetical protein
MSDQYFGTIKKVQSKSGTEYFKGHLGKVPVVGFHGKDDKINFKLDVGLIKWIDEQEDDGQPDPNQRREPQPEVDGNSNDLPF